MLRPWAASRPSLQVKIKPWGRGDLDQDLLLCSRKTFDRIKEIEGNEAEGPLGPESGSPIFISLEIQAHKPAYVMRLAPCIEVGESIEHELVLFCDTVVFDEAQPCAAAVLRRLCPIALTDIRVRSTVLSPQWRHELRTECEIAAKKRSILMQGQPLHRASNFLLESCDPVLQGYLTPATAVTICYGEDDQPPKQNMLRDSSEPADLTSYLNSDARPFSFTVILRSFSLLKEKHLPDFEEAVDLDNTVFVNPSDLLAMGAFNCSQCVINDMRTVWCFSGALVPPCGSIYMTPTLAFNLSLKDKLRVVARSASAQEQIEWPVADFIDLSRVQSPWSSDRTMQATCQTALQKRLMRTRCTVAENDIICVGINENFARLEAQPNRDEISINTAIFYKVNAVQCTHEQAPERHKKHSLVYIDTNVTKVTQNGTSNLAIPNCSQWFDQKPSVSQNEELTKLSKLFKSWLQPNLVEQGLVTSVLVDGPRLVGKTHLIKSACDSAGYHLFEMDCYEIMGDTHAKTEGLLKARMARAISCAPCAVYLKHIEALASPDANGENGASPALSRGFADCLDTISLAMKNGDSQGMPVALCASTATKSKLRNDVVRLFRLQLTLSAPDERERLSMLRDMSTRYCCSPRIAFTEIAKKSASLVAGDLENLFARARWLSQKRYDRMTQKGIEAETISVSGTFISSADMDAAVSEARQNYSESIGAPKIPSVRWEDVGGLADVKQDIVETIQLPLSNPELFSSGLKKRSGVLLYGPPGTGKTLLAKAVATTFSLNFFSIKGPELLNMYIGESEANVRRVFQKARDARPCVVFFDELDSVAPKRGNQGDSGGVMDRIVSQLLAELDGMANATSSDNVFVIGATNRPDLLDPALLRPGRFDKLLYLGISDTHEAQLKVLQALTNKFTLSPDVDLQKIVESCSFNYTGADFYALSSDAMLKAMSRKAAQVDAYVRGKGITAQQFFDSMEGEEQKNAVKIVVEQQDFWDALSELVPSVSLGELAHYKRIKAIFSPEQTDSGKQKGVLRTEDGMMDKSRKGKEKAGP